MRRIKQSCCAHGTFIEVWVGARGVVLLIQMILSRTSSRSLSLFVRLSLVASRFSSRCAILRFVCVFRPSLSLSLSLSLSFSDNPLSPSNHRAFVTMLLIQRARHSHLPVLQLNKESCASGLLHARARATKRWDIRTHACKRHTGTLSGSSGRKTERGWLTTPFA